MYNVQRTATIRAMSSCRLWKMDRFIYLDLLLRDAKAQRQRLVDFVKEMEGDAEVGKLRDEVVAFARGFPMPM